MATSDGGLETAGVGCAQGGLARWLQGLVIVAPAGEVDRLGGTCPADEGVGR